MATRLTLYAMLALGSIVCGLCADLVFSGALVL
jgi:hypothetical protein